jgi:hypothetical protein
MRKYKDRRGVEHSVEITLLHRRQIRERLEIDLVQCAHEREALEAMLNEVSTDDLCQWEMLAIIEGTTAEALMDAADGETAVAANEALIEAIIDFFPERSPLKAPLREYIRKAMESQQAALQAVETEMLRIVEGLNMSSVLDHVPAPMNG